MNEGMNEKIATLQKMIDGHERIVFFGGAGVSTESGIPDYRSSAGTDRQKGALGFTPEEMRHHDFLMGRPDLYFENFRQRMKTFNVEPNAAHHKLVELERAGRLTAVVTQNIDGLHQKAGSRNVFELHGSCLRAHCLGCGKKYDQEFILACEGVPKCDECGAMVRPDIVLFGEALDQNVVNGAVAAIRGADMLIIGGTSLVVYPAAGLVDYFRGDCLVVVNQDATSRDGHASLHIQGPIGQALGKIIVK